MSTENTQPYDSREDTLKHIQRVQVLLEDCALTLKERGAVHDASKLEEPEKSAFDRVVPKLAGMKYGTDEYRAALRDLGPALEHHYAANSHHPEHYKKGQLMPEDHPLYLLRRQCALAREVADASDAQLKENALISAYVEYQIAAEESRLNGMDLFDVIEMLMDWKAASERMQDGGDIYKSIDQNRSRFGMSQQLVSIFYRTAERIGWTRPTKNV